MNIFLFNGEKVTADSPLLKPDSRSYRYGDGFFESIKYSNHRLLHSALHFIRIRKTAMLLKMQLPEGFNQEFLENMLEKTCAENGISHARIRCTFYRDCNGLYTPISSECSYIIEIMKTDSARYDWNEQGIRLGAFRELTKNGNFTSTLKTTSALTYVMAGIYAKENDFDDCIIFNDQGRIAETVASNIFMVSGEFIKTPPLSEYCLDGVMRKVIMQQAQSYGYTIQEQPITEISLQSADEIFLSSATRGIRWVGTFGGKKYGHTTARVLSNLLNRSIGCENE